MKQIFVLLIFSCFYGCVAFQPSELSPEGRLVRVMKGDPSADCVELGTVQGGQDAWEAAGINKNRMRNAAAKLGANYVRMESVDGFATGTAFKCP